MTAVLVMLIFTAWAFFLGKAAAPRLPLDPLATLCLAPAVLLAGLYQLGFLLFILGVPYLPPLLAVFLLGLAFLLRRRPVVSKAEWAALGLFAGFVAWIFCLQALIPLYDGGGWAADWYEHYHRALFFLHRLPLDTRFLDVYPLPSRPPAQNLLTALFQSFAGDGFAGYQMIAAWLNALPVLGVYLIFSLVVPPARPLMRLVPAAAAGLAPAFLLNATYAWTRGFTNYLILAALFLYVRGDYGRRKGFALAALLLMTTAALGHYSGAVFLVPMALHFTAVSLADRRRVAALAAIGLASVLVLASWFGWSLAHYGAEGTFLSNTTAQERLPDGMGRLRKDLLNFAYTAAPLGLASVPVLLGPHQPFYHGVMVFYAASFAGHLTLALGLVLLARGWPVLGRAWREADPRRRRFWVFFAALSLWLGVTTVPGISPFGLAHVNLQPWLLLGVGAGALLLVRLRSRIVLAAAALLLLAEAVLFSLLLAAAPGYAAFRARLPVDPASMHNIRLKLTHHLAFFADLHPGLAPPCAAVFFGGLFFLAGFLLYAGRAADDR